MNCNEYENLITDYLEDKVTPDQRRKIESHFSECEICRTLSERERSVMAQLNDLPVFPCPDEIIDRTMEKISEDRISLIERIRSRFESRPFLSYRFAHVLYYITNQVNEMLHFLSKSHK